MPFCIHCGAQNAEGYKFCIKCGQSSTTTAKTPQQRWATDPQPSPIPPTAPPPQAPYQAPLQPGRSGQWFSTNKKWLLPVFGLLIIGVVVYQVFLKANPGKEGKALAAKECGCAENKAKAEVRLKNEFLVKFNSYGFADGDAARQRLNEIEMMVNQSADSCQQAVRKGASGYEEKFKNPEAQRLFMQSYYDARQQCNTPTTELSDLDSKASTKIEEFDQQAQMQNEQIKQRTYNRTGDSLDSVAAMYKQQIDAQINQPQVTSSDGADFASVIGAFYAKENAIASVGDIEPVLAHYEFPLVRYYDAYYVDKARMEKIYADSYFKTLSQHRVYDFENNVQTEKQPDGNYKVTVGCNFEFSTQKSPADVRTRNTTNVYILSPAGKIKSVQQLR